MKIKAQLIAVAIALLYLAACKQDSQQELAAIQDTAAPTFSPTASVTPTGAPTPTATQTPSPTMTPSPTATPTPTPTLTPTARPILIKSGLRASRLRSPEAQAGAPCGVVDILDFPLYPPDAAGVARGGQDFGVYRERYNGIHTGEDWWAGSGRSSFRAPVYSIGHGMVTYAAPLGWGADQGGIIIHHTFPDGSTILSFYGHMDPPSVELRIGDCVARGQQIARIGRPRTPPHLHFEIRSHMPAEPGPGYWWTDPTTAGWEAPSKFIWNYRIATSPGVLWNQSSDNGLISLVALDGTLLAADSEQMMGINLADGSLRWSQALTRTLIAGVLDADQSTLYLLDSRRELRAFDWSDPSDAPELLWDKQLGSSISPALMPLPGGGVAASLTHETVGLSPQGDIWWEAPVGRTADWVAAGDQLLFSISGQEGSIWAADQSGAVDRGIPVNGRLAAVGDQIIIYAENGVYRFDPATNDTTILYPLPRGLSRHGDLLALADGTILAAHADIRDRRLIALSVEGELLWERSYSSRIQGQATLLELNGQVYLFSAADSRFTFNSSNQIDVYSIDLENIELVHIFTGGTRIYRPVNTIASAAGQNTILINIGGANLVALDPQTAQRAARSNQ